MSEQPFTAGPWEVAGQFVRTPFRRGDPNAIGLMIADVRFGIWTPAQHEANARLIAAAPAMYEALKLARAFAEAEVENREHAGGTMSDYINEAQEVVDAIDAAISQAEASKKEGE